MACKSGKARRSGKKRKEAPLKIVSYKCGGGAINL